MGLLFALWLPYNLRGLILLLEKCAGNLLASMQGKQYPLLSGLVDVGDLSPRYPMSFDTVWVRILVPPNDPPEITVDLAGNTFEEDTLFIRAGDDFCFDFSASDINAGDSLSLILGSSFNQPGGPTVTFDGGNPLQGQVCWGNFL